MSVLGRHFMMICDFVLLALVVSMQRSSKSWLSTMSFDGDNDGVKNDDLEEDLNDLLGDKTDLQPQGVDPRKGWGFRGVHKVFDINFELRNIMCLSGNWIALLHFTYFSRVWSKSLVLTTVEIYDSWTLRMVWGDDRVAMGWSNYWFQLYNFFLRLCSWFVTMTPVLCDCPTHRSNL